MTRARELARLANENVLSVEDDSLEVGINSTTPTSALDVRGQLNVGTTIKAGTAGVVTATEFSGSIGTFSGAGSFGGNLDVTGNVTIGGTLTYEDVTNIDSVGIVTARAGVNVSGGQLLVGSGVTIGYAGVATFSGTADIHLKDNVKLNAGDSLDLNIYHDGSNSYIQDSGSGALIVTAADQCVFQKGDGSNRVLNLHTTNGTAALMHQGNQKLITSSSGVSVTGDTTADGLIVGSGITMGSAGVATFSGTADIHLTNAVELQLGDSKDLKLYHNASGNNWMYSSTSAQDLYIGANAGEIYFQTGASANDTAIKIVSDSFVELRYDNNWKLQTTNDGIYVNGIGTATRSYVNSPSHRENDNIPLLVKGIKRAEPVIGIQGESANGVTLIGDAYVDGESQFTLGLHYSGSGLVLGQVGVSTTTNNAYVSIQDYYAHRPAAMVIDDGAIKFRNDSADGIRPVGTAVTMYDRMTIENSGRVLIGDGSTYSANGNLHIVGDNNSNGPELYLQVNNNNTTDNIGALWYGNNGDKSLSKIAGHTKLASNTSYLTFHTSKAGTLAEQFQINNDGVVVAGIASDAKGDLRKVPANTQTGGSAYTLVAADSGKLIARSGGSVTIPNSVFTTGDMVTILNNSGSDITLTASVSTLYNTADGSTGNRTLAARGMATIYFTGGTSAYISGSGLS